MVIGPMAFEDRTFTFDPNPEVYRRFGLEPPRAAESNSLWWKSPEATPGLPDSVEGRRALLCKTLQAAKRRGWAVWLFCPHYGAGPGAAGLVPLRFVRERSPGESPVAQPCRVLAWRCLTLPAAGRSIDLA